MRQLWESKNIHDYTFAYQINCFCPPETLKPFRIVVKNDSVVEAVSIDGTVQIPTDFLPRWETIPKLFEKIEQAIKEDAYNYRVEYDQTYGYPQYFDVHWEKKIPDSYGTYKVWELKVSQ